MRKKTPRFNHFVLLAAVSIICVVGGGRDLLAASLAADGLDTISRDVETTAAALGYLRDTGHDLTDMIRPWNLAAWKDRILQAKQDLQQKKTSVAHVAIIEKDAADDLFKRIRKEIRSSGGPPFFDLSNVVRDKKANCLGYSQLFYIIGNSIGLSVQVVKVHRQASGSEKPHVACIIYLRDKKVVMADLVPGGFISKPFHLSEEYVATNGLLELKDSRNTLHLHNRITIWGKNEFASDVYLTRAIGNVDGADFTVAMRNADKAILMNPKNAAALRCRAALNNHLRRFSAAISDTNTIIAIDSRNPVAYELRAFALSCTKDYHAAIRDYSRAINLDPRYALAYAGRGSAYARLGEAELAKKDLQKALELDPSLKKLTENSFELLKLQELKKRLRDLKELIKKGKEEEKEKMDRPVEKAGRENGNLNDSSMRFVLR